MRDKDMMDGDQPIINVEIEIVQKKKSLIDKKTIEKDVDIWIRKQEHVPNGITGCPAKLFPLGYLLFCWRLLIQIAKVGTFL